jgi:hypothetical protein
MVVVSFTEIRPQPRYDGIPWSQATIAEAASSDGPWTDVETLPLVPTDTDPGNPQPRNLTTENANDQSNWFRVTFADATGEKQAPTEPMRFGTSHVEGDYVPNVREVAALIRSRTKTDMGQEIGTFNDNTRPTDDEVIELINQATADAMGDLDYDIPEEAWATVRALIVIGAAMRVEISYFPELNSSVNSPYDRLERLYNAQLKRVEKAVERETTEETTGDERAVGTVAFGFPPPSDWMYRPL